MEHNRIKLTADKNVVRFLEKSADMAKSLPEWKIGVLEASSQSANSTVRTPIVNQDKPTAIIQRDS